MNRPNPKRDIYDMHKNSFKARINALLNLGIYINHYIFACMRSPIIELFRSDFPFIDRNLLLNLRNLAYALSDSIKELFFNILKLS